MPRVNDRQRILESLGVAADTAYGTGKFLGWLTDKGITPHIPVWEKGDRADGIFSRADFIWDKRHGHYICPNRKLLRTSGTVHDGRTLLYRALKRDCDVCLLRSRCCTRDEARKIPRSRGGPRRGPPEDENEGIREVS